jgi:hypothetical protein
MTIQAVAWAIEQELEPTEKLVLILLANHGNQRNQCFPSVRLLAHEARMSMRTITYLLGRLAKKNLISRERQQRTSGKGGRGVNLYTLASPLSAKASAALSVGIASKGGDLSANGAGLSAVGCVSKKDSSNHHLEPRKNLKLKLGKRDFPIGTEFVEEGTPAWKAWASYLGKAPPVVNFGWHFPSKYPPEARQ